MTQAEVDRAHKIAARRVLEDPSFLPVFERMEALKAKFAAQDNAIARARAALENA
ncbi:hypothetical protein [uncultured Pelagimonas sp.]|uniref:hypothetical protein n=1 Tax=uncultured Pelagimonas sp. TaxID=1618102 RepID=UPI0026189516|nr:hypothetical protein [uncultured Pelagimonas sp.]